MRIEPVQARSILTRAGGVVARAGYDYALNPYQGCAFGCSYCYAANFAVDAADRDAWGEWVKIKENAAQLLSAQREGKLDGKAIYMSSATDPYQPVEQRLQHTRALLEVLVTRHRPRLTVQTRAQLVTRDLDLLRVMHERGGAQVNVSVTTDDEDVRRAFEPTCPPIPSRLAALSAATAAGVPAVATISPALPIRDPEGFAERLAASGVIRVAVDRFHPRVAAKTMVGGTRETVLPIRKELGSATRGQVRRLAARLSDLGIPLEVGDAAFRPPPARHPAT